ncbi:hypothetical protein TgHK011_004697 [Trichoderma gracile]|nr:hypothetical protein TgHK011_004697 [Trichoderma gracile]
MEEEEERGQKSVWLPHTETNAAGEALRPGHATLTVRVEKQQKRADKEADIKFTSYLALPPTDTGCARHAAILRFGCSLRFDMHITHTYFVLEWSRPSWTLWRSYLFCLELTGYLPPYHPTYYVYTCEHLGGRAAFPGLPHPGMACTQPFAFALSIANRPQAATCPVCSCVEGGFLVLPSVPPRTGGCLLQFRPARSHSERQPQRLTPLRMRAQGGTHSCSYAIFPCVLQT